MVYNKFKNIVKFTNSTVSFSVILIQSVTNWLERINIVFLSEFCQCKWIHWSISWPNLSILKSILFHWPFYQWITNFYQARPWLCFVFSVSQNQSLDTKTCTLYKPKIELVFLNTEPFLGRLELKYPSVSKNNLRLVQIHLEVIEDSFKWNTFAAICTLSHWLTYWRL